jgi:hypothetical protein
MPTIVLEGTWDEIITHAAELAGKRIRLTVLDEATPAEEAAEYAASVAALLEGFESFQHGEGRPAREALEELRQKLGLCRNSTYKPA